MQADFEQPSPETGRAEAALLSPDQMQVDIDVRPAAAAKRGAAGARLQRVVVADVEDDRPVVAFLDDLRQQPEQSLGGQVGVVVDDAHAALSAIAAAQYRHAGCGSSGWLAHP